MDVIQRLAPNYDSHQHLKRIAKKEPKANAIGSFELCPII